MTDAYLSSVGMHLRPLSRTDRKRALEALAAQLAELREAGIDPEDALGGPGDYAVELLRALADDPAEPEPHLRLFGVPVETRGPLNAEVRSRTWAPENPRVLVPRLFGAGWAVNLGALAVKLRLIRPDDATEDVLDQIPERTVRAAQFAPLAIAGVVAGGLALAWRHLPARVATGFDVTGHPNSTGPKWSLLGAAAVGMIPALWAARRRGPVEDRLVRSASATTLAAASASVVVATVLQAQRTSGRFGLLVPAALPLGVAASLAVIVVPLRSGLRHAWRAAEPARASHPQ